MRARLFFTTAAILLVLAHAQVASAQGHIFVDFYFEPGTGFDDPTPAAPVGGNTGTTVGEQRRNVFLQAAALWEEVIKPQQDIWVAAEFLPLGPGVLGAAGPQFIWSNFPGAELQNTWYFDSLADHLVQVDLSPITYDILANFSSDAPFYRGLDNNEAPGQADLLVTVLHEIGHGLNFANAVTESTGEIPSADGVTAFGDIYSQYTMDVTTNKGWNEMTNAERAASAINVRKVSWSGLHLRLNQHRVLERGEPAVRVLSTAGQKRLMLGTASFGPPLTANGVTGNVVLAKSATNATDGCAPIVSAVAGGIALIDRGTCTFNVKVKNAQDAGAIAVLIADNVFALPPSGLGGADPTITIPSGRISLPDADAIKINLAAAGVRVRMFLDKTVVAGTDRVKGQVMLAAFNPVVPGSSISHFEPVASPNQIMEPAINADLVSSLQPPEDLTTPLLTDLGWFTDRDGVQDGVDVCLGSDPSPTVVIGACDSGVPNTVRPSGCNISDVLKICAPFRGRAYEACVSVAAFALRLGGEISSSQQKAINRCVR